MMGYAISFIGMKTHQKVEIFMTLVHLPLLFTFPLSLSCYFYCLVHNDYNDSMSF